MADLNELNEKVEQIKADIREQLEKIENTKGVYEYKKTILDKNGIIGGLMKQMGSVPKEEKADFGKKVNELKNWASEKKRWSCATRVRRSISPCRQRAARPVTSIL